MRLEDFGITPEKVKTDLVVYSICFILICAVVVLLWCLFGIGLARIAKKKGEEKEWYAYLPLLRLYTLGKMTPGSEKTGKIFGCLLPSLAVIKYIMLVVSGALLVYAAAAIIFSAGNIAGAAITLDQLITFPITYFLVALIITAVISLIYNLVYAYAYYGAVRHLGGAKAVLFALIALVCSEIGCVLLFVASNKKYLDKEPAEKPAEEAAQG